MSTRVLILCTHNSARSPLAEAMLNHWARALGRDVQAYSAGSHPSGGISPFALEALRNAGVESSELRSKSWDEFAAPGAPAMDIVITVCDSAAAEPCPHWPGSPIQVHWGYFDPGHVPGDDNAQRLAFELTRQALGYRMLQLLALPVPAMSRAELQQALERISRN